MFFIYCHPDPRRMWQGGPVLQLMTPDPGNPGNRRIVPNHRFASTKPHVIEKKLPRIAVFRPGASQGCLGCSGEHSGRVWRSFGRARVAGGSRAAADDTRSGTSGGDCPKTPFQRNLMLLKLG